VLHVDDATYIARDQRTVRVTGGRWVDSPYTVKIEGAQRIGYRSICVAGIRDDAMIANLDSALERARDIVVKTASDSGVDSSEFHMTFRVYGRDAIMGAAEPVVVPAHEVCVLADVVAARQKLAHSICAHLKTTIAHIDFDGQRTTAGNVAFPFSPAEFDLGPVYSFNVWHALPLSDPCELFAAEIIEFPRKGQ